MILLTWYEMNDSRLFGPPLANASSAAKSPGTPADVTRDVWLGRVRGIGPEPTTKLAMGDDKEVGSPRVGTGFDSPSALLSPVGLKALGGDEAAVSSGRGEADRLEAEPVNTLAGEVVPVGICC